MESGGLSDSLEFVLVLMFQKVATLGTRALYQNQSTVLCIQSCKKLFTFLQTSNLYYQPRRRHEHVIEVFPYHLSVSAQV